MLRVAFTSEFRRGKLQDLVALLSGRNFETKQYEEAIAEESFARLKNGILALHQQDALRPHHDDPALGGLRDERPDRRPERRQLRLHPLSARSRREACRRPTSSGWCGAGTPCRVLRGRYTGSPETAFDFDIRQIEARGLVPVRRGGDRDRTAGELLDGHAAAAHGHLVRRQSPYFLAYQAAQVKLGDKGFLSRDITVLRPAA